MGGKKANVAVGHSLLKVVWCVLKTGQPYREPDASVMHEMERQKLVRHHCAAAARIRGRPKRGGANCGAVTLPAADCRRKPEQPHN